MEVLLVMNIFTFLLLCFIGYASFQMQSKYPNTTVGYHVSWAMKDKETWIKTNKLVGVLLVLLSIIPFLILPIVFYMIKLSVRIQVLFYFIELILLAIVIIFLPKKIINQDSYNQSNIKKG